MTPPSSSTHFDWLYLEPEGGVAGDMLLAALCDLGADVAAIDRAFQRLGLPGLDLGLERVVVDGEPALHVRSLPPTQPPHHRRLGPILALVEKSEASAAARAIASRVFTLLAEAEAEVHGERADTVPLHEVGQLDSVLDILGIAVAWDSVGNPRLRCGPLPLGMGTVRTAHGNLVLPVPAVRAIVARAGVPTVPVGVVGETVTPTGIAVVATLCTEFGPRPSGVPSATGIGAGTRRFPSRRNVVRLFGFEGREGCGV